MQKRYYGMGLISLGLLVSLGFVWLGRPGFRSEATRLERPTGQSTTAMFPAPVVQQGASARAAVHSVDLQSIRDERTARQQRAELAALQQQQDAALEALWQRLEQLFAAQRTLTQQFDDLVQLAAYDVDASQTPDEAEAASEEATTEQIAQTHEAQAVDPAWSAHAQTEIAASFARIALPEAVLLTTECRTTVCRIEVAFEGEETRDKVVKFLPYVVPWSGEGLLHVDPAAQTVIFYAAREGEPLEASR